MRTILIIIIFLSFSSIGKAQEAPEPKEFITDTLPLDPDITQGKLSNGFEYYLKPLESVEGQVEFNFLVKAGSNHENSDQYALAHFLEHIVLHAGKHVSTHSLYGTELSQELGISRGSINALTAQGYTQFIFKLPNTDKALTYGFQFIKDIMSNVEFKDHFIDTERSPFFDESEFRGGESSLTRYDSHLDATILGCAQKVPEDFRAYINTFHKEKLIRFYEDWYRPDLMGLIITGDVQDRDSMENRIKEWFSDVPQHIRPRPHRNYKASYFNEPPRFVKHERPSIFTDRYATMLHYRFYFKQLQKQNLCGREGLQNLMNQKILLSILKERFALLKETEDWPFQVLVEFPDDFSGTLKLSVEVQENHSKQALARTIAVLQQLRKHGILTEEFQKAKTHNLQSLKASRSASTWYWKDELKKHFMDGEALPDQKNVFLSNYMEDLSESDIETFFKENYTALPHDIGMIAPAHHPILQVQEKTVRDWLSDGQEKKVRPFKIPKVAEQLMESNFIGSLEDKEYEVLTPVIPGTKRYRLSNGLELVLKSFVPGNNYEKELILFQGISKKGAQCFPKQDYYSAINAREIIVRSGVGNLKKWELKKYMSTKNNFTYVNPYIHYMESGIRGRTSIEDLETALQLIYLYFTHIKKDNISFENWQKETPFLYSQNLNRHDLRTHIKSYLNDTNFLPLGTKRLEGVRQTDLDTAYAIYKSIFGMAEDFTFLFSGDFDHEMVLKLCNTYLGNLPNIKTDIKCPSGQQNSRTETEPIKVKEWESNEIMNNNLVNLIYRKKAGQKKNGWKERTKLSFLANLMDVTLMSKLRFKSEEGGPYDITVTYQYDRINEYNEFIIQYGCDPKDLIRLNGEFHKAIKDILQTPFDTNVFQTVRREFLPPKKEVNAEMLEKMADNHRNQTTWYTREELRNFIFSLTPSDIHRTANENLNDNFFVFRLVSKNQ